VPVFQNGEQGLRRSLSGQRKTKRQTHAAKLMAVVLLEDFLQGGFFFRRGDVGQQLGGIG
jgi:hypothetical protein